MLYSIGVTFHYMFLSFFSWLQRVSPSQIFSEFISFFVHLLSFPSFKYLLLEILFLVQILLLFSLLLFLFSFNSFLFPSFLSLFFILLFFLVSFLLFSLSSFFFLLFCKDTFEKIKEEKFWRELTIKKKITRKRK